MNIKATLRGRVSVVPVEPVVAATDDGIEPELFPPANGVVAELGAV